MPLQERLLVGGAEGSGKTYAYMTIARALPEHKFYIIDPDDGVRRVWYPEFPDVNNIEYYFTPRWFAIDYETFDKKGAQLTKLEDGSGHKNIFKTGVVDAWATIKPKLKPDDWVIAEHMHLLWNSVQDTFADEVFDKNIGQYFLEKRKVMREGATRLSALEGWTDWTVIKKLHNDDFVIKICYDSPAHIFMTTSVTVIQSGVKEDPDIKAFYGDTSIRFEGEKHNVFRSQTKLIMKQEGRGQDRKYLMNTFLKDRGRQHMDNVEWSDFYFQYLVSIAGWI